ncbi:MAG: DDE-type integrase/transposase/recombinase [Sphingomonas sp.]|nr:DDE-type integrase/transposase/recombinase [Sphingomonas sp.]
MCGIAPAVTGPTPGSVQSRSGIIRCRSKGASTPSLHGFAYVAIILDAWSRRVVGYAIGRSIDARLAIAALKTAVASRRPPPGLVHHSDRGSQYVAPPIERCSRPTESSTP